MKMYTIMTAVTVIVFIVSETMTATAQEKLTYQENSTKQKIVVTWLKTDETKSDSTPVISISSEDFGRSLIHFLNNQLNET